MNHTPPEPDEVQAILDELATTIHNLSPGDIGSMDRVLVPIAEAKAALLARERRLIAEARLEEIEDIDQSRDVETDGSGYIHCDSCMMQLESVDQKCGCNYLYDQRKARLVALRHPKPEQEKEN
jgi:hypothetical protein